MRLETILDHILGFFGRKDHKQPGSSPDEICSLIIDPSAGDIGEEIHGGPSVPIEAIQTACRRMQRAKTRYELLRIIADEVGAYDLHDLEAMNARFEHKVKDLPGDYRDRLLASVREEIFGTHHRLILLARNGAAPDMDMDAPPGPAHPAYWAMVAEACTDAAREKDPKYLYLKYLLAGFAMVVLAEPAHPVGTPFPGGQIVDEWEGTYLCPVRDKADDVPSALCPYCPAVQSTEPTFLEMRARRLERRRQECLANYWRDYKG
ncbi:MAG: DUF2115 domain-containing protein [Candidatus Methanoculleus thermohydrogenotrophicum]|jgi:uncharacterized protein (UPF0305 family)